jgi:hypothetical protein
MAPRCLLALVVAPIGGLLAPAAVVSAGPTQRFCVSIIRGGFDSDRRRDTAVVYSTRRGCDTTNRRSWQLVVRLASGRVLRRALGSDQPAFSGERDLGCDSRCAVRAAPDFNRDGLHEIEVALQEGASQEQRGIYGLVGGELRRLPGSPAGDRFSLSYGGGLTHGAYVVCRLRGVRHLVVAVGWGIADKAHSAVREDIYRFEGLRFRLIATKTRRMSTSIVPPRVSGRTC